jgi:hypothetical protein
MNKLLALFFLFGAIGGIGMSFKRTPYEVQDRSGITGTPVGPIRVVYVQESDRIPYLAFGIACLIGCAYFIVRARNEDSRRLR